MEQKTLGLCGRDSNGSRGTCLIMSVFYKICFQTRKSSFFLQSASPPLSGSLACHFIIPIFIALSSDSRVQIQTMTIRKECLAIIKTHAKKPFMSG